MVSKHTRWFLNKQQSASTSPYIWVCVPYIWVCVNNPPPDVPFAGATHFGGHPICDPQPREKQQQTAATKATSTTTTKAATQQHNTTCKATTQQPQLQLQKKKNNNNNNNTTTKKHEATHAATTTTCASHSGHGSGDPRDGRATRSRAAGGPVPAARRVAPGVTRAWRAWFGCGGWGLGVATAKSFLGGGFPTKIDYRKSKLVALFYPLYCRLAQNGLLNSNGVKSLLFLSISCPFHTGIP